MNIEGPSPFKTEVVRIVTFLGALTILIWLYNIFWFFWRTICGTACTTERYGVNSFAFITNANNVMGMAASKELVRRGFNIFMVADTD
jgi:hypothetical protein